MPATPNPAPGLLDFLRRRVRRIAGWALLFAVGTLSVCLLALGSAMAPMHLPDQGAQSFGDWLAAVAPELLPYILALVVMTLAGGAVGALTGAVVATLVPRRLMPLVDGLVLALGLNMMTVAATLPGWAEITGLPPVTQVLPTMLVILLVSSIVWRRLPFGLSLQDGAEVTLNRAAPVAWTDLCELHEIAPLAKGDAMTSHSMLGFDQRFTCPAPLRLVAVQQMPDGRGPEYTFDFDLHPRDDGKTDLRIQVVIRRLSPLAWWEYWSRPFASDYADHIAALVTGSRDTSVNGFALRRQLKRQKTGAA